MEAQNCTPTGSVANTVMILSGMKMERSCKVRIIREATGTRELTDEERKENGDIL